MGNRLTTVFAVLLTAIPLMFFIALVDPSRESVGLQTYFTSVVSLIFFRYLVRKNVANEIGAMILDGLNEEQIQCIAGEEKYRKMLDSL